MRYLVLAAIIAGGLALSSQTVIADEAGNTSPRLKRFERMDSNGDGVISKDEFMNTKPPKAAEAKPLTEEEKQARKERREKIKKKMQERQEKAN